jgi:hypothetical protein
MEVEDSQTKVDHVLLGNRTDTIEVENSASGSILFPRALVDM